MLTRVFCATDRLLSVLLPLIERIFVGVLRRLYSKLFVIRGSAGCRRFEVGTGNAFNVPVRGEGPGTLIIGSKNSFGYRPAPRQGSGRILLQARGLGAEIRIGNGCASSNNISIIATQLISIGDDCLIGDNVVITDSDAHEIDPVLRASGPGPSKPVFIGKNVWLGSRVMVMKGVTIGDNSVIGAMSLVNKSIPPNCVAAGNPAKVLRNLE
ncbi:MAG: acyltransferase [Syntrophobacteraceae bacterium]